MATNEERKAQRRAEPVHLAPRVPGRTLFAVSPVVLCGATRGPRTKVAGAFGVSTCPECRARYRATLEEVRRKGAIVLAQVSAAQA